MMNYLIYIKFIPEVSRIIISTMYYYEIDTYILESKKRCFRLLLIMERCSIPFLSPSLLLCVKLGERDVSSCALLRLYTFGLVAKALSSGIS